VPARRSITVAVGQFHHGKNRTVQENTATIIAFIKKASKAGAQVVTFHETATTGYSASAIRDNGHDALLECERAIAAACRTHAIACVVGTAHFSERHGTIHNTALVIDDKGRSICRQSKLQLVPTDHWAVPGDDL
jgi:predicted amidohydrolase